MPPLRSSPAGRSASYGPKVNQATDGFDESIEVVKSLIGNVTRMLTPVPAWRKIGTDGAGAGSYVALPQQVGRPVSVQQESGLRPLTLEAPSQQSPGHRRLGEFWRRAPGTPSGAPDSA